MAGMVTDYQWGEQAESSESPEFVREAEKWLRREGVRVTSVIEHGDAAGVIVDHAKMIGADLIVMGSRGRSGLARWMLGSVADRAARSAGIPVLLITSTSLADERSGGPTN